MPSIGRLDLDIFDGRSPSFHLPFHYLERPLTVNTVVYGRCTGVLRNRHLRNGDCFTRPKTTFMGSWSSPSWGKWLSRRLRRRGLSVPAGEACNPLRLAASPRATSPKVGGEIDLDLTHGKSSPFHYLERPLTVNTVVYGRCTGVSKKGLPKYPTPFTYLAVA